MLYVSDTETSDVYVYSYPAGKLMQTLKDFRVPGGECVDAKGDVFVANTGDEDVVEFAHGGSKPLRVAPRSGGLPIRLRG